MQVGNYMGIVRVDNELICLAGGLQHDFTVVFNNLQFYNPKTNSVKCKPNMIQERYTFPLVDFQDKLYALGGRTYGDANEAILNHCEAYSY